MARACLDLLVEGEIELAPATVAVRSGVSRKTLYRWWPTRTDLLRNALAFHTRRLEPPDTGSWAGDVHALVAQLAEFLADPVERAQNAILASGLYPDFDRVMLDYYQPIQASWRAIVERGVARGEVADDVDPDLVVSAIASPLLVLTLLQRRGPSARERRELERLVLRATRPEPAGDTTQRAIGANGPKSPGGSTRRRRPALGSGRKR